MGRISGNLFGDWPPNKQPCFEVVFREIRQDIRDENRGHLPRGQRAQDPKSLHLDLVEHLLKFFARGSPGAKACLGAVKALLLSSPFLLNLNPASPRSEHSALSKLRFF